MALNSFPSSSPGSEYDSAASSLLAYNERHLRGLKQQETSLCPKLKQRDLINVRISTSYLGQGNFKVWKGVLGFHTHCRALLIFNG